MIAGGGNIGLRLGASLDSGFNVKLIEIDAQRAKELAIGLHDTLVLHGNVTDEKLLENEGIDETDLFVALTSDEEDNIMSATLAKRMGARYTLALINRKSYVGLVEGGLIDIVISPAQASIGMMLTHVRRGDVVAVHRLRRGAAEALEIVTHGQRGNSRVVGRTIGEIHLPEGVTINAIVRENPGANHKVLIPDNDTVIESGDHVMVFCPHKNLVKKIEKLFQVGFAFL
jgi:trk system potassium uptake protein TrkA